MSDESDLDADNAVARNDYDGSGALSDYLPEYANDAAERLWDELLLQACASDGPIRDADVRQAITIYRPKIEAAERRATVKRIRAAVNLLGRARKGSIYDIEQLDILVILDAEAER